MEKEEIYFEVSALEETPNDLVSHFEIKFSEPISATWLIQIIRNAIDEENESRQ